MYVFGMGIFRMRVIRERLKLAAFTQPIDLRKTARDHPLEEFTIKRLRPILRRVASTLRPLRVCIRLRKPCSVLRFFLLGWYVRLTMS